MPRNVVSLRGRQGPSPQIVWGSVAAPVASPPPATAEQRYPDLNVHRGIAALAIVMFNVYQFCNVDHVLYRGTLAYPLINSLDAAVPWFFVLTGFQLFKPIATNALQGAPDIPAMSTRRFLSDRALRIVPVYYLAVLVVWFSRQQSLPGDWRDLSEHLTFIQVFDEKRIFYTNGPAWAVSVIVMFCLVLAVLAPVLTRVCHRLTKSKHRIAALASASLALAAVSLAWKASSFASGHRPPTGSFTTWFGPTASLDNFAIGMGLAILLAALGGATPFSTGKRLALRLAAILILIAAGLIRQSGGWGAVFFSTECSLGFACLIAAAHSRAPERQVTSSWSRPLAWIGTISYGIYLWHEPILLALPGWHVVRQAPDAYAQDLTVVTAVSVLAGLLTYLLVEKPTARLSRFLRRDWLASRQ